MAEISLVIPTRFGDEQSTLLDQFERLSFEIQLNQAEPIGATAKLAPSSGACKGRRCSAFNKLLKPILCRKGNGEKKPVADPKPPLSWKAFSRSLRF
ncbi:hypothetical protein GQ457_13G018260 [Hibiscus cannabinus]